MRRQQTSNLELRSLLRTWCARDALQSRRAVKVLDAELPTPNLRALNMQVQQ
jgi:hypothetical protein